MNFHLSAFLALLYVGVSTTAALVTRHRSTSSSTLSISTSTHSSSGIATSSHSSSVSTSTHKSTTTSIAPSSSSITTSSTATATAPTIPNNSGCNLPQLTITKFYWYNGTHDLDCGGNGPDIGDGTVCLPGTTDCGIYACDTGIPNLFLPGGPPGYGPPDQVTMTISNYGSCNEMQGISVPASRIGYGSYINCGGAGFEPTFSGNSNIANGTATITVWNFQQACVVNGVTVAKQAVAQFALNCVHDSGGNATCVSNQPSINMVWELV